MARTAARQSRVDMDFLTFIDYASRVIPVVVAVAYVYREHRKTEAAIHGAEEHQSIRLAHEWQDSYGVIKKEFDDHKKDSEVRLKNLEAAMLDMKSKHNAQRKSYETTIKSLKRENKKLHGEVAELKKVASFLSGFDEMERH